MLWITKPKAFYENSTKYNELTEEEFETTKLCTKAEIVKEASIQIESSDGILHDLFYPNKISIGSEVEIKKGVSLRFEGIVLREAVDVPQIIEITLILTKDVVLPVALNIASNWLYDKIRNRKIERIRINGVEVQVDKEKITQLLIKEIEEKPIRETHVVNLYFPKMPKKELLRSARTLSERPIIFDGNELPYPDNKVYFADYFSGKVRTTLYIRDEDLNALFHKGITLYATVQTAETVIFGNPIFTHLILSSKKIPSGHKIETCS
jgi:hypothetical protein